MFLIPDWSDLYIVRSYYTKLDSIKLKTSLLTYLISLIGKAVTERLRDRLRAGPLLRWPQ